MKVKIKYFFLFFLLFLGQVSLGVPDSLIYRIDEEKDNLNVAFNGSVLNVGLTLENYDFWLFSDKDDYRNALKNTDDSKWQLQSSDVRSYEDSVFKGFGWFRLHYKGGKSLVGTTLMLRMTHFGASEIFNDGKFVTSCGLVSHKDKEEISLNPSAEFFPVYLADTLEHVLAIRYSNAKYSAYNDKYNAVLAGFILKIFTFDSMLDLVTLGESQRFYFTGISFFLFGLAMVHLMIFLFERSRKFNLYHSFFVFSLALIFLFPVIGHYVEVPVTTFRINYYTGFLVPTLLFSALVLLYNLFQRKHNKFFYLSFVVYIGALIMAYFFDNYSGFFYITLFFNVFIGATILSIKGIRQNFRGAKIVGVGVVGITVSTIISILSIVILQDSGLLLSIFFAILGILSLPLSMSVYLAYDFAAANKTLKEQIVQIEDLSEKAIREEQEKKQILENQNVVLEQQVKERTAEITKQKEIIEEKNKDITDSINYAKRIQEATLASKEIKYSLFSNAFVLFKPKDIVSGDFYWFAGKDGKRLIAACDCTGHGVPGALMSMIGNNLLNKIVNERAITGAANVLTYLDQEVRLTLKKEENIDSKDGMDVAMLTFSGTHELEYAGANRPLWLVRNGKLEEIKATKISIGGDRYGENIEFTGHNLKLQDGDTVYISSDGFADQFNNEDKKLMTRRFKEILLSIQHLSMTEQEKYLDEFIEKWKGGLEQTDDILVIGIRI